MKKIQSTDEAGRATAQKRYGNIDQQSKHGHSVMGQNLRGKYQMQAGGTFPTPTIARPPTFVGAPQLPSNPVMPTGMPPATQQAGAAQIQQNLAQRQAAMQAMRANAAQNMQARRAARIAARPTPPVGAMPPTGIKRGGRVKKGK